MSILSPLLVSNGTRIHLHTNHNAASVLLELLLYALLVVKMNPLFMVQGPRLSGSQTSQASSDRSRSEGDVDKQPERMEISTVDNPSAPDIAYIFCHKCKNLSKQTVTSAGGHNVHKKSIIKDQLPLVFGEALIIATTDLYNEYI